MKDNTNEFYQSTIFEQGKNSQVTAFEVCDEAKKQSPVRVFFPEIKPTVYRTTGKFSEFIGKTFKKVGFKKTHTVKIIDIYGSKKKPIFRCEVIKSPDKNIVGQRCNFLCSQVITNGCLCLKIKYLGA